MISALRSELSRITLRHAAIPTTLELVEGDLRADGTVPIVLVVVLQVHERDSGEPMTFRHCFEFTGGSLVGFARRCVHRAWEHELDEVFLVDGIRHGDPHRYDLDVYMKQPAAGAATRSE